MTCGAMRPNAPSCSASAVICAARSPQAGWLAGRRSASRIVPQVLGQAQRAVQAVAHAATAALGSVTENPVYLPASPGHPFGRVLSTGGFHNGRGRPSHQLANSLLGRPGPGGAAPGHRPAQRHLRASCTCSPRPATSPGPPAEPPICSAGRDRAGRRSPGPGRAHPAPRHHRRQPERHRHAHFRRLPQPAPGRRMPGAAGPGHLGPGRRPGPVRRRPRPRHHPWLDC